MESFLPATMLETLRRLSPVFLLLDEDGRDVLRGADVPQALLTRPLKNYRLAVGENVPGAETLLDTATQWMKELLRTQEQYTPRQQLYRAALNGEGKAAPLHARVLYFSLPGKDTADALHILEETLPLSEGDALLSEKDGVLFIKTLGDIADHEELRQFVCAVAETIEGETSLEAVIGVGGETAATADLSRSRQEAVSAVQLGRRYRRAGNVFFHERLLLERFLSEIPADTAKKFAACLQEKKITRLLNEEMLLTVNTFFEKDLSVSDTARQLYIHRNTLLYRLDKLEKATGLDLRRFDDAVILKLLLEIRK